MVHHNVYISYIPTFLTIIMTEWKAVRSKITNETYTQLLHYCKNEEITPSRYIRDLIEKNILTVISLNKAGVNSFEYDKSKDAFTWTVSFDDGQKAIIGEMLSHSFLENLQEALNKALSIRELYIRKGNKMSIAIPNKLRTLRGGKDAKR